MAFATLAAQGAGTAAGIMGALFQGESDSYSVRVQAENRARQAESQASADEFNAIVTRQLAEHERTKAAADAGDYRRTQGSKLAHNRALMAAGGFNPLEGSPLAVDAAIFQEIEFGAARIGYGGDVASARGRNQAALLDASAKNERMTAKLARESGAISAENIKKASYLSAVGAGAKGVAGIGTTLSSMTDNDPWGVGTKKKSTTSRSLTGLYNDSDWSL